MNNKVLLLSTADIKALNIQPSTCVDWIRQSFLLKYDATLPPKISIHPQGNDFFNTMPCALPSGYFAVKEVSRILGRTPSLSSDLLLYNSHTGRLLALMDADWITSMRTGAAAALSISLLRTGGDSAPVEISFIGLGNTARATLLCLLAIYSDRAITVRLLRYKDQAESFIRRFKDFKNLSFEVVDDVRHLISSSKVLVSSITDADGLICEDDSIFPEGITLVPIHTRGFQNCDLFFDRIYGDDTAHVEGFKYFSRYRYFEETPRVVQNPQQYGRQSDKERILVYNIGLALHDALFASKIYELLPPDFDHFFTIERETSKFFC